MAEAKTERVWDEKTRTYKWVTTPATGWEGMNTAERTAWVRGHDVAKIVTETGLDEATAARVYDQYGGKFEAARDAAKIVKADADKAAKKAEDARLLGNKRGSNINALDEAMRLLEERKGALTGDYAKSKFQTDLDIERAKAEAQGGRYGVDTNADGVISDTEYVNVDPRMSTAGRTQTQMVRNDNSRGLLNSTLSQGAGANASDALQRQLMQFTGGKQTELANTKKAQDAEIADATASFNEGLLNAGTQTGDTYETYDYKDPETGKVTKKTRIKAATA